MYVSAELATYLVMSVCYMVVGVMASKYAADGDGNTAVEWLLAISAGVLTIGVMALTITDFIENMAELQKMAAELGVFYES